MSNSDQVPQKLDSRYEYRNNAGESVSNTSALATIGAGVAAGAVLMYLLDPGRRRTIGRAGREATRSVTDTVQELLHRTESVNPVHQPQPQTAPEMAARPSLNPDTDWNTSAKGHAIPTPPKPASAISRLVPPALGAVFSPRVGGVAALIQSLRDQTWNPRTRNTALLGGALSLYSLFNKRSMLTVAAGMAGTALLAKGTHSAVAAANAAEAARAGNASVQIETSIRIDASPEDVFDAWVDYENFPRFMENVVEVRDLGADLSHWTVKGPAGTTYEWDSILTERMRPHTLAWQTVPGAKVEQRGEVLLEPVRGGTRATVRMSYIPPAGKAGQALATLLGSNPKAQLEQDLKRLKRLLEAGPLPRAAAKPASRSQFLR